MRKTHARFVVSLFLAALAHASFGENAPDILGVSGVRGGVIVHVGCGGGRLTAALRMNDRFLVHGLDTDPDKIRQAREHIHSLGLYGEISVDTFGGIRLPYVSNSVNLLVADPRCSVTRDEIMRVLAPGGVFVDLRDTPPAVSRKPRPADIDEWTHYMHDPSGSCLSRDTRVGPPRRLQWVGAPRHARSHEHTASLHALVSARGRMFDVTDLGSKYSIQLPSKYTLTARDAFNGTILWKRELPDWFNHLYPLKSGPAYMPRRLVAVDDTVYVSPGAGHNLLALDAATGEVRREYEGTTTTVDLVLSDGTLFLVVDPEWKQFDYNQQNANCWKERDRASAKYAWTGKTDRLMAVDAASGNVLWQKEASAAPLTLAVEGDRVCLYDGNAVVCLDRKDGQQRWASEPLPSGQKGVLRTGYAPKLIMHGDYVLYSPFGKLYALSAETGKTLWATDKKVRSGHFTPEDLFVIDDLIWAAGTARGRDSKFVAYDLKTGALVKECPNTIQAFYMHQRCYPGRATIRYLLPAATGTEFVDLQTGEWEIHHWVRGGCIYGMMPANGLLYATPQACACYYQSKLNGFNALTAGERKLPPALPARLEKGPAYGAVSYQPSAISQGEWPAFRHDNVRSGRVKTDVPATLKQSWSVKLGSRVSQAVSAGGKVFVSAIDEHTVHALDAATGRKLWSYTAGGRVDSPPTIYRGMALFGCADGYVYALRATDGELVWRFRAAPVDQRLMSYGQLESVWPVSGSVLVEDGVLYCVAGRSMFLDGGMRMLRLKPQTGELLSETVMDDKVPGTDENLQTLMAGKHMPVTLPDILSSDGKHIYMKSQTFDKQGKRTRIEPQPPTVQDGEERHLFAPISFLDDSWFHRAYWIYGRAAGEGWAEWQLPGKRAHYGRIMCFDDDNVYAYGRDPELLCNSSVLEYRLYSATKDHGSADTTKLVRPSVDWHKLREQPEEKLTRLHFNWKLEHPPFLARAMVLANDTLFVAGVPDVVDEEAMWGLSNEPEFRRLMKEQAEAIDGSKGAVLWAVSTKDGTKLLEQTLDVAPAFDGMTAAGGRLFVATADGEIVCIEGSIHDRVARHHDP